MSSTQEQTKPKQNQHLEAGVANISERRGKAIGLIPLPQRLSAAVLETHAKTVHHIADQPCPLLQKILKDLELEHYGIELSNQGFDTWGEVLGITEADFDLLNFRRGHRRKLQQKIRAYKDAEMEQVECDKEDLLELKMTKRKCEGEHEDGQGRQGSIVSQKTSSIEEVEQMNSTLDLSFSDSTDDKLVFTPYLDSRTTRDSTYDRDLNTIPGNSSMPLSNEEWRVPSFLDSFLDDILTPQSLTFATGVHAVSNSNQNQSRGIIESLDMEGQYSPALYSQNSEQRDLYPKNGQPADKVREQENPVQKAACFYVRPQLILPISPQETLYRALYLRQRTLDAFLSCLAEKCNISESHVVELIWLNKQGHHICFDDNVVQALPEGQAMIAEFQVVEVPPMWRTPGEEEQLGMFDEEREGMGKSKYYKVLLMF